MTLPRALGMNPKEIKFELVEDEPGFTLDEAYAFLAGADASTSSVPKITVAATEVHTGAMIALIPSEIDAARLAILGGESNEQLHCTLLYLGEADDISPNAKRALVDRMRSLVEDALRPDYDLPVVAEGFAVNIFNPPGHVKEVGKERETCIVLGLSGGDLATVHNLTEEVAREVQSETAGFSLPDQHEPWIPHVTLIYAEPKGTALLDQATARTGPVTFDRIRLAFGGEHVDIPLRPLVAGWTPAEKKQHPRSDATGRFVKSGIAEVLSAIPKSNRLDGGMTSTQRGHVNTYETGAYQYINEGMRAGKGKTSRIKGAPGSHSTRFDSTENVQRSAETMKALMQESKLRELIMVHRGIVDPRKVFGRHWNDKSVIGLTWTDHGFVSTTPDVENAREYAHAHDGVMMNIHAPTGVGALLLESHSGGDGGKRKYEVVLDHSLKYRVIGDSIVDGIRTLDVEVLP